MFITQMSVRITTSCYPFESVLTAAGNVLVSDMTTTALSETELRSNHD
jgi:hypothetical protein